MKQGSNQRRPRGRSGNSGGGNSGGGRRGGRNQNFDSNGPEVKVRGSAQQVLDKYLQLARDAQSSGDRVKAEGYLQFAEHYYRVLNADQEGGERQQRGNQGRGDQAGRDEKPQGEKEQAAQEGGATDEAAQGAQTTQGDKKQETRAPRGRRRSAPAKNEATLAAEAAAANEARAAKASAKGDDQPEAGSEAASSDDAGEAA